MSATRKPRPRRLRRNANDLVGFAERCGVRLEPFQRPDRGRCRAGAGVRGAVARGHGKTHLLALIALHHLVTVEDAAVVVLRRRPGAGEDPVRGRSRLRPRAGSPELVFRHLRAALVRGPGRAEGVPAAPAGAGGRTPASCTASRIAWRSWTSCRRSRATRSTSRSSALHKRPGAKMVVVWTAGQGADSPLGVLRARALAQPKVTRRGAVTDARGGGLRMLEWATRRGRRRRRREGGEAGEPGRWITVDQLRAAQGRAARSRVPAVRGEPVDGTRGPLAAAGRMAGVRGHARDRDGEKVWIGVDVGGERSASAVVWVNERLQVGWRSTTASGRARLRRPGARAWRAVSRSWRSCSIRGASARPPRSSSAKGSARSSSRRRTADDPRLGSPARRDRREAAHAARRPGAGPARRQRDRPPLAARVADRQAGRRTHIDAIIALCMALDRLENQPEPVRLVGWL